jgi:hypothetical protein
MATNNLGRRLAHLANRPANASQGKTTGKGHLKITRPQSNRGKKPGRENPILALDILASNMADEARGGMIAWHDCYDHAPGWVG